MNKLKKKFSKFHVTNPNFFSKIYFSVIYSSLINLFNFSDKKILDFGGGQGFLKKKLKKKYNCDVKIYDIIPSLSDLKNWKSYDFDCIIFCQVLCLLKSKHIKLIFEFLKKKKNIYIISVFSKQTIINKIFAFVLGHKDAHGDTKTFPEDEKKILLENFKLLKSYNFLLFEILILSNN